MKGLPQHDQRRSFRFPVNGFAVVHDSRAISRCTITNLSLGGALFRGRAFADCGNPVNADLAIAGIPDLTVNGRVVRCQNDPLGRKLFAISFSEPSADTEDLIHDLSVMILERVARPAILIVEPSPSKRQSLAHILYHRGWRVLSVETPLQALSALNRDAHIYWTVVGEQLSQTSSTDLLRHVKAEYPEINCALLAAGGRSEAVADARRAGIVDCVLQEPLSRTALDVLGTWPPTLPTSPGAKSQLAS